MGSLGKKFVLSLVLCSLICLFGAQTVSAVNTTFGYGAGDGNLGDYLTAIGAYSGDSNSGDFVSVFGVYAGYGNSGNNLTAVGYDSGRDNDGGDVIGIGNKASYSNEGDNAICIGKHAGHSNEGDNVILFGEDAGADNTGDNVVAIGYEAGKDNSDDDQFIVKQANVNSVPLIQGDFDSGRIGIGTSNPARMLHVQGSNGVLRLDRDANAPSMIFARFPTGNYATPYKAFHQGVIASGADEGYYFISDLHQAVAGAGNMRLVIDTDGNVGIGTTNPSSKLAVNGDLNVNGSIFAEDGIAGNCLNVSYVGGMAVDCND